MYVQGTLFLPVVLRDAWVQSVGSDVHLWSGPAPDSSDFGPAGPVGTVFTVMGPQVLERAYVYDPITDTYGWIDAAGVTPSGPPAACDGR